MDIPLPGSSLNKSITSQWQTTAAPPRPTNRKSRISLNPSDSSSPSSSTKRDRERSSRGGSPAPASTLPTVSEPTTPTANGTGEPQQQQQAESSAQAGTKRPSSALTPTQPASSSTSANPTKRARSSKLAPSSSSSSRPRAEPTSADGTPSRSSLLSKYPPPDLRLSLLGGLEKQITQLLETVALPLLHPEIYKWTGVRSPKGVLLHGVPGGGKTRLVGCLAGELSLPFISISAPSLTSSLSGDTERLLRDLFAEAKALAPCILFLDEVDAITPKRENAQREMEKRIVGQLLTCMDELANHPEPVIVLAATNRPDSLDPALRRAGRFDHEIEMGVPSVEGREEILKVLCSQLRLAGDIDFHALAMATPGYVGADLTALTGAAGVAAVKRIFQELGEGRLVLPGEEEVAPAPEASQPERAAVVSIVDGEEKVTEGVQEMMVVDGEGDDMVVDGDVGIAAPAAEAESEPMVNGTVAAAEETAIVRASSAPWGSLPAAVQNTPIASFLTRHPHALTERQLSPIRLIPADFADALKTVQPSAQREGFATVPDVTWADIGALHGIRDELHMAIVQPIRRPELFKMVGIDAPSGVLLWGPPGCGKTLLAKAVANESRANFISVKGPELLNKYVGESERAVRQVFARARSSSPCVIFFDELDALVPRRDDSMSESSARLVNTLLTELDGLDSRKAVYVVGATNRPDMIDPAMTRPGRLDKLLYVDLPTPRERVEILKTHLKKTPLAADAWDSVQEIVQSDKCDGFSGADMAALVREAASLALRTALEEVGAFENDQEATKGPDFARAADKAVYTPNVSVTIAHFAKAAEKTLPSVSRDQKRKYEALRNKFAGLPVRGGKKWAVPEEPVAEKPEGERMDAVPSA